MNFHEQERLRGEVVAAARALGSLGEDLTPILFEHFARFAPAARAFRSAPTPHLPHPTPRASGGTELGGNGER